MRILRARPDEVVIHLETGIQITYSCCRTVEPTRRTVTTTYVNGSQQHVPKADAREAKRHAIGKMRELRGLQNS